MAWTPISNTVPQYSKNAGGAAASGYYLKFYADGTTTPILMATDNTGGATLAKCQLNTLGYPINGSSDVFIPHIDQDYKLALYENEADADSNALINAAWVIDNISVIANSSIAITSGTERALTEWFDRQAQVYDTVSDLAAETELNAGDYVIIKNYSSSILSGPMFGEIVASGTGTDDGGSFIDLAGSTTQFKQSFIDGRYTFRKFGAEGDGVASDKTALQNTIAAAPAGSTVYGSPEDTYLITSFSINKVIDIDLNGATIKGAALTDVGVTLTENVHVFNGTSDNVYFAWSGTNVKQGSSKKIKYINPAFSATTVISGAEGVVIEENYFTGRASGVTGIPGATTFPVFQMTTGAQFCKFINNIVVDVEAGITADGITSNVEVLEVSGNIFQQMRFYALKTDVGNHFIFKNNYVGDARYGVFYANVDTGGVEINRTSGNQLVIESNSFVSVTSSPTNNVSGDGTATGCNYVSGANNPYPRAVFRDNYMTSCDIGCARTAGHTLIQGNHFYNGFSLYDFVDDTIKSGDLKILNNVIDVTKEITGRGNDLESEPIKAAILIGSTTQDGGSNWVPHIQIVGNTFRDCHTNCIQLARVAATFPQIKIKDNVFDAGANTVNNINISTAIGLTIADNEIESAVSGENIKYPNTSRIGGAIMVENNEWQIVSTAPTTGTHIQGTVFRNSAPAAAGNYGWICTTTGDLAVSGVVKSFGTIAT